MPFFRISRFLLLIIVIIYYDKRAVFSGVKKILSAIINTKAVQINKYGGSEVLEVREDVAKPIPTKGQVLVEVYAAGLNPIDWKIRAGYLKEMAPLNFPVTLGGDFAGIVVAVGEGVTDYQAGDEVYGQAIVLNGDSGSFAQYVSANTANLDHKPTNIDFNQAGALPLAGVSALPALEDHLKLKKGEKILIQGGAGVLATWPCKWPKLWGRMWRPRLAWTT